TMSDNQQPTSEVKKETSETKKEAWQDYIDPETGKPVESKSRYKKLLKLEAAKKKKESKQVKQQTEKKVAELKSLKDLKPDPNLPKPTKIKIRQAKEFIEKRVEIYGWAHRVRKSGNLLFIVLRDGTGYLQCVIGGASAKTIEGQQLTRESSLAVYGKLVKDERAINGVELQADFRQLIGTAPGSMPFGKVKYI